VNERILLRGIWGIDKAKRTGYAGWRQSVSIQVDISSHGPPLVIAGS
jgi:hypothetical protein